MDRYSDAESVRKEHIEILGPELGPVYHELYNECAWLHIKWQQYVELYGDKPERIDLMNRSAGLFFRVVQDALWEDTLLNLTRLTDPPKSAGKRNLTIQQLPVLITDVKFSAEIQDLVNVAIGATNFARDWRNRRIAHNNLALALNEGSKPLTPASRKHVKDALFAVSRVLQRISEFYFKADLYFGPLTEPYGARSLLYVLRDGVELEERRQQRLQDGKLEPEDMEPPRDI